MYKLTMQDSQTLDVGLCGAADGVLWLQIYGKSLLECAEIFSEAEKTAKMEYDFEAGKKFFEGYTALQALTKQENCIQVALRKN